MYKLEQIEEIPEAILHNIKIVQIKHKLAARLCLQNEREKLNSIHWLKSKGKNN